MVINSLIFLLLWNVFISAFLKSNVIGYRRLWVVIVVVFYLQHFKYFTSFSLCLCGFWWEVLCDSYPPCSVDKKFTLMVSFKINASSLVFCSLNMTYLGGDRFYLFLVLLGGMVSSELPVTVILENWQLLTFQKFSSACIVL